MGIKAILENAIQLYPERNAVTVNGEIASYYDVKNYSDKINSKIDRLERRTRHKIGILTGESICKYVGIISTLLGGNTYVPLSTEIPLQRILDIVQSAGIDILFVEDSTLELGHSAVLHSELGLHLLNLSSMDLTVGEERLHKVGITTEQSDNDFAYIIYTSGSTGKPKGVPITINNLVQFYQTMNQLYDFSCDDIFSQIFEITFDFSVLEMFLCWGNGAELKVVPSSQRALCWNFLANNGISIFCSVPSKINIMSKMGVLDKYKFDKIRISFFCGEPLLHSSTIKWAKAAENSKVINLYGPTEATVACMEYDWTENISNNDASDVVPIGKAFPNMKVGILDGESVSTEGEYMGELLLNGSQTSPGYWNNSTLHQEHLIQQESSQGGSLKWYRTGDIVKRDESGCYFYINRLDSQIKHMGYRIELGDIDSTVRNHVETPFVATIQIKNETSNNSQLVVCLAECDVDYEEIFAHCKKELPTYMIPSKILNVGLFPLNANGKVDRNRLTDIVERMLRDEK